MLKSHAGPFILDTRQDTLKRIAFCRDKRILAQEIKIVAQSIGVCLFVYQHLAVMCLFQGFKLLTLGGIQLQLFHNMAVQPIRPGTMRRSAEDQKSKSAEIQEKQGDNGSGEQGFSFHHQRDLIQVKIGLFQGVY